MNTKILLLCSLQIITFTSLLGMHPQEPSSASSTKETTNIHLAGNTNLDQSLECTDGSIIDGESFTITLQGGDIIVAPGATLIMRDVTIEFSEKNSIVMGDDSSTVLLKNVTWIIEENYHFSTGRFIVDGGLFQILGRPGSIVCGFSGLENVVPKDIFHYKSPMQSRIKNGGTLKCTNICFRYAPTNREPNLLLFEYDHSLWWIKNSAILNDSTIELSGTKIKFHSNVIFYRSTGTHAKIILRNGVVFSHKNGVLFINCSDFQVISSTVHIGKGSEDQEFLDMATILKKLC